ncbi:MAG: DUF1360 domain-containing protein, partial [Pseudomonadota bacterium]
HTIARERLFAPLRRALGGHDTWLGYLVSCPYCVSHWVAFLLVPVTGTYAIDVVPRWGAVSWVLRWLLSSVLVTAVAAFLRVAFYFVDETQGLVRRRQKTVEAQTETVLAARERLVGSEDGQRSEGEPADARH